MVLPWPELKIPTYHPLSLESWSLRKYPGLPQLGYFTNRQGTGEVFALLRDQESWMSTAWDEIESQAPHVAAAQGHVVIMGAGMGVVLYNILQKTDVERVTLVERDPVVLDLLRQVTDLDSWPGIEKLTSEIVDAFDYRPRRPVDFLYVDIWALPGDVEALPHTRQIQQQVQAASVGWWTQEIEFLFWLESNQYGICPTIELYCQWAKEIGLPLIEQHSASYPACIEQVAQSYCYRMVCQRLALEKNSVL